MDDTRYRIRDPRSGATQDIPDGALPFFQNQGWVVVETLGDPPDMALPAVHVVYADDANALRPQTTQPVVWYGAVEPIHLDADNGDKWVPVAAGPAGPIGASGTIVAATASALPAGANPTVTLGGTQLARTIALGLPGATVDDASMVAVVSNTSSATAGAVKAAIETVPHVYTQPQQMNGWLGVGVAPSQRQPFNTYVSLAPGMAGTKDKVGNALVTNVTGDYTTGETGSNPSFLWGLNAFVQTAGASGGAGLNLYNLVETALGGSSGTIPVAVGLMSEVAHFGSAAGQHATQMISHLVGAPKKKDGATGGTAGTAYGLKIENTTAAAAGATTAFALFVEGGVSRFQGRVDVAGDIQAQTSSFIFSHPDAPGTDGGGRFVIQNKTDGGSIAARLGKPSASFQILKSTDGSIVHSFNETQLGFWKSPVNKKTGWVLPTGTSKRSTYDTATVTLAELAGVVKAIVEDLHGTAGYGLLNT